LQELRLNSNQLTGQFFFIFGWSVPLTIWFFVQCYAGAIPESLGNLVKLQKLYLNNNHLTGQFFFFSGSVPTDQPIFRSILRREHPWIPGEPCESAGVEVEQEPTLRSIFLVFQDGQCPLTIWNSPYFYLLLPQEPFPSPWETLWIWLYWSFIVTNS
jgi:hypothetical protein